MNKLMLGSAMGFMMGVGLMMSPMGKPLRKEMNMGISKAKQMMKAMERM